MRAGSGRCNGALEGVARLLRTGACLPEFCGDLARAVSPGDLVSLCLEPDKRHFAQLCAEPFMSTSNQDIISAEGEDTAQKFDKRPLQSSRSINHLKFQALYRGSLNRH